MRMKRVTSVFTAVVMMLSLMAGFSFVTNVSKAATVKSNLPMADGIYMYDWVPYDGETGKVREGKDQNGNSILVNWDNEYMEYCCQDGWYLKEDSIKNGDGPGVGIEGELWFDYVTGGKKVTHIPLSKLKFTHLDGTPGNEFVASKWDNDSRAVSYKAGKEEPVLVTYTGAKKNNKMVIVPSLGDGFYTASTKSFESYISNYSKPSVVRGKSKDFYLIIQRDKDSDNGILVDTESMLTVGYWDNDNQQDVTLTEAADVKKYATATLVSDPADVKNVVVKVTVNAPEKAQGFCVRAGVRGFNINNPSETWHEFDQELWLDVVDGNVFEASYPDAFGYENGKIAVTNEYSFDKYSNQYTTFGAPLYLAFRYTDGDGNRTYITDVKDLSFYQRVFDREKGTVEVGDKLSDTLLSAISIERPNPSSPVLKLTVPEVPGVNDIDVLVGYKDNKPNNAEEAIRIRVSSVFIEDGFFTAKKADATTRINMIDSDGTKDIKVYYGGHGDPGWLKSASVKSCALIGNNEKEHGIKVKGKNGSVSFADGESGYGAEVTIPAGALTGSAALRVVFNMEGPDGDKWTRWEQLYINYVAPKKGSKINAGGVTYTVTGKNAVSVSKVKASAKSVTIPAKVGAMKVTGIAAKAMKGCGKLTKITVKSAYIKSVGKRAFTGVPAKAVASVPKAKKAAYAKLFKKGGYKGKVK